ncbi:MAG: hypothetical protein RR053_07985 [Evtepia sp.]
MLNEKCLHTINTTIRYSDEIKAARETLWRAGKTDRQIADAEGVPRHVIVNWRRRRGFPIHRVQAINRPPKKTKAQKPDNFQSNTLCWSCQNACGACEWSQISHTPVPGWTAIPTHLNANTESFEVIACPKYLKDPPRRNS